jgi:hypothetical protein
MVQQDVIINVIYKMKGKLEDSLNKLRKFGDATQGSLKTLTEGFDNAQESLQKLSGIAVGSNFLDITNKGDKLRKTMDKINKENKKFKPHWIGIIYFGRQLTATFKGLTNASLEMAGVFDVLNSFLGMAFLPLGMFLLDVVLWLWDAWDALPEPVQNFINILVAVGLGIGIFLTVLGTLQSGFWALQAAIDGIGLSGFGASLLSVLPLIAAVAAMAVMVWMMFGDDIKDLTRNTWRYVNAVIKGNTQEAAVYWELLSKRIQVIGLKMMEYAAAPFVALFYLIYYPLFTAYNLIAGFLGQTKVDIASFTDYMKISFNSTNSTIAELEREIGITEKSIGGYEAAAINAANTTNTLGSNTNLATKEMELFKTYMDAAKGSADMMTDSLGDIDSYLRQVNASAREAAAALNTVANVTGMTPSGFMSKEEWVRKQAAKGAIISPSLMPFLQHGGLVTKPTPALIGERGPEAVIPLDRIGSIGGVYVTINTSNLGGNVDAITREIVDKLGFELARVRY